MRKPLDHHAIIMMLILCGVWGLQQVAIKSISLEVDPIVQASFRSGVAAMLVAVFVWLRGDSLRFDRATVGPGLLIAFFFAFEFFLIAQSLLLTSASHVAVLLYTAPIFAAVGLHWRMPSERLTKAQWWGVALAFFGIFVIFGWRSGEATLFDARMLLGDALALLAGLAWGATTVVIRCSTLSEAAPAHTLLYQLVGGCVLLAPLAIILGKTQFHPGPLVYASLFFQAVIISFVSYLVWFGLLRSYQAARLGILTLLTPVFGVAFGIWLLGEPIEASFLTGSFLVLASVLWVSASERWTRFRTG